VQVVGEDVGKALGDGELLAQRGDPGGGGLLEHPQPVEQRPARVGGIEISHWLNRRRDASLTWLASA
jgi:hypothetical protein